MNHRTIIQWGEKVACMACRESDYESDMEYVDFVRLEGYYCPDCVPEREKCSDCEAVLDACKCEEAA